MGWGGVGWEVMVWGGGRTGETEGESEKQQNSNLELHIRTWRNKKVQNESFLFL